MDRASIRVEQALSSLIYKKVLKKRINLKEGDESIGEILNLQVFHFFLKKIITLLHYVRLYLNVSSRFLYLFLFLQSVDAEVLKEFVCLFNDAWAIPFQIVGALVGVGVLLGSAVFGAILTLLIIMYLFNININFHISFTTLFKLEFFSLFTFFNF